MGGYTPEWKTKLSINTLSCVTMLSLQWQRLFSSFNHRQELKRFSDVGSESHPVLQERAWFLTAVQWEGDVLALKTPQSAQDWFLMSDTANLAT